MKIYFNLEKISYLIVEVNRTEVVLIKLGIYMFVNKHRHPDQGVLSEGKGAVQLTF
jgi:hypothetical protein